MKTYYMKKKGKFVPAGSYDTFHRKFNESLPIGWYIVHVSPNAKSCRTLNHKVEPDRTGLLCALREFSEVLVTELGKAMDLRMKTNRTITPKAQKLWDELNKELGDAQFYHESADGTVEEAIGKWEEQCISRPPISNAEVMQNIKHYFDKTDDKTLIENIEKRKKKFKEEGIL